MDCICESCARKDCRDRKKEDDLQIVISCNFYLKYNPTIADSIRSMSDEELAAFWAEHYDNFCQNKPECCKLLDTDEGIPEKWCVACALDYIRRPAEGNDHEKKKQ